MTSKLWKASLMVFLVSMFLTSSAFAEKTMGEFDFLGIPLKLDNCMAEPQVDGTNLNLFTSNSVTWISMNDEEENLKALGTSLNEYKKMLDEYGEDAYSSIVGMKVSLFSYPLENIMQLYYIATMDFGKDVLVGIESSSYIPQLNMVNEEPVVLEVFHQLAVGLAKQGVESMQSLQEQYVPGEKGNEKAPIFTMKDWGVEFCGMVPRDRRVMPHEVLQNIADTIGTPLEQQKYAVKDSVAYAATFDMGQDIPDYLHPVGTCSIVFSLGENGVMWRAEIGVVPANSIKEKNASYYTAQDAWNVFEPMRKELITFWGQPKMYFTVVDGEEQAYVIQESELASAWENVQKAESGWIEMFYGDFSLVMEKIVLGDITSNNCWLKIRGE